MKRRSFFAGALLALLFADPVALAAPASPDRHGLAVDSFHQAEAAFARREYAAAAAAFEAAARFEPHPEPWLDAEEAWEKAGDLVHAAEDCDAVLAIADAADKFRDEAKRRLAVLTPKLAEVELHGPRDFAARVDDGAERVPPSRTRVTPGAHRIAITNSVNGRQANVTLTLVAGESKVVDLAASFPETISSPALVPAPADLIVPSEKHGPGPPIAAVLALGLGGAATIVTGVFGGLTLSHRSDFNAMPSTESADAFHRDKLVTNVALGAAIVGVGAGIVLWAFAPRTAKTSVLEPSSAGLALRF